jgi:hypothetical protein
MADSTMYELTVHHLKSAIHERKALTAFLLDGCGASALKRTTLALTLRTQEGRADRNALEHFQVVFPQARPKVTRAIQRRPRRYPTRPKLSTIMIAVATDGHSRVNPSEYFSPIENPASNTPATTRIVQKYCLIVFPP